MNKRSFEAVLIAVFLGMLSGCAQESAQEQVQKQESVQEQKQRQEQSDDAGCRKQLFAMDTYMEFAAYGEKAEEAVDAAIKEVKRLDELLSTGKEDSEISKLNQSGSLQICGDTAEILDEAVEIYEKTDGLFDFTIYPLMKLWGFPTQEYQVPSEEELNEALPLVNASLVEISPIDDFSDFDAGDGAIADASEDARVETVTLAEGQQIDFGGIAKGYTSSRVMEIFEEYGIQSGMVSLGGNVQVLHKKPDGTKWNIGVRDPDGEQSDAIAVVSVENCAVITSGGYERYFEENGQTYIHIIDPRTGYPVEGKLRSVTVLSENGTLADALSTSLYIMGFEDAVSYWQKNSGDFDMVLITDKKEIYITEGIQEEFHTEQPLHVIQKEEIHD